MGYTQSALSGFSWQTILKIAVYGLVALKMIVLARVLSPEVFGLFSLVTIALGVTEATTQTGVNLTILRSKHSVDYFLDSAWVIAIARGMIIGIIMILLGFFLSSYFVEPQLLILISLAALVPAIKGFINPSIVGLQKNLHFFKDGLYRLNNVFTEVLFAVIVGVLTKSIFALVGALIFSACIEVVVSFVFFEKKPRFVYQKSRGGIILSSAKWLGFSALFDYLNENADNFLIGKVMGVRSLGLYHYGYSLSHKVNFDFARSAIHGTLPIYAKLQSNKKRLLRAFYRTFGATLSLVVVGSLPLLFFPAFFVNLILGEQWLEVVGFVRPLVLAGILQSVAVLFYSLFIAKKDYLSINLHLGFTVVLMVSLVLWLSGLYGLQGAAAAIFISRLLALPILGWRFLKIKNEKLFS